MEPIKGKIALVTGGTRGIGRAIAERLLKEGAAVAFCGQTHASVDRAAGELAALGKVFGAAADIREADQVRTLFQSVDREFGGLDILVNNAAEAVYGKVAELTIDDWRRNIDLNLNGAFYCAHEALARMLPRGGGSIINISSLAGKNACVGGAGYNASKFGLNGLTEALMLDHRNDNIRVCSIMPGSVDTGFSGHSGPAAPLGTSETAWKIAPQDIADVVYMVL